MLKQKKVIVLPSIEKLAEFVTGLLIEKINQAQAGQSITVALSGGSTPGKIFESVSLNDTGLVDWNKIKFFWGDERCVPPDDPDSNYLMARQCLFEQLNIPGGNIFRIQGEEEPEKEAVRYSRIISENVRVEDHLPRFDLILLGLGEDGHTASIFPDNTEMFNSTRFCEVATHPKSGQQRITLTGPVINNAKDIVFIVTGSAKSRIVAEIIHDNGKAGFPASLVKPVKGKLTWLLDEEAAKLLS
ncbi:MAG: 6-phosphogluconolactonase [Bacteroidota bacterium]|nr:6-phosphogluconolactonase [Bacteroidota bacterium]